MSTSTYAPRPTISVAVTGPSPRLAMLRALLAKAHHAASIGWAAARRGLRAVWRLPRAVADATLAVLATDRGYTTVTGLLGTGLRTAFRLSARALRWAGRGTATIGRRAADAVSIALPGIGQALVRAVATGQHRVSQGFDSLEHRVQKVGELVAVLAGSDLVRCVTTRLAAAASGLLAVHVISQGALATKLVAVIPAAVHLVAWATSPWLLLAGLGLAFLATITFAAIRLWRAGSPDPDGSEPSPVNVAREADHAFEAIVSRLRVVIDPDGSVRVDGVPADLPEREQRDLATTAARAAVSHLGQVARRGHAVSSAHRRAATRAAKSAARDWLADLHLATA